MSGAGARDRRITIQSLSETITDGGEVTESATDVCKAWAQIAPLTARENWIAQQSQATTTHKIKILYRPDITHEMQATYDGRTFRFDSVVNIDEANRHLLITATEVM